MSDKQDDIRNDHGTLSDRHNDLSQIIKHYQTRCSKNDYDEISVKMDTTTCDLTAVKNVLRLVSTNGKKTRRNVLQNNEKIDAVEQELNNDK